MEYFNLDISKVQERCEQRGDIKHVRFPIRQVHREFTSLLFLTDTQD